MLLSQREEQDALLTLFGFCNQKSHSVAWPWCWLHQNFFLDVLECLWKIPLISWRGAKALNTHASVLHLRKQNKKSPWHLYTYPIPLFVFDYVQPQRQSMNVRSYEVTEANLSLHFLQIDCVVIFQLFLLVSLLFILFFTQLILLPMPCLIRA